MQINSNNPYQNQNLPSNSIQPIGQPSIEEAIKQAKPEERPEVRPEPTPPQESEKNTLANNDEARQNLAAYAGHQSKMSQIEMYIQGSTGNDVDLTKSTDTLIQGYMDVKKQNDAMAAYSGAGLI
ncbi:MAG: hypothetical protein U9N52_05290 [Campylobacterota bacterium]|nr:hypothetical protein [Campylobacterota bacterium]